MLKDSEVFQTVLDSMVAQYGLEIKHPYADTYMEIFSKDGQMIGSLNTAGKRLLTNLTALTNMLNSELL